MNEPMKCRCGAKARIRIKDNRWWVECRDKCGVRTGYYTSVYDDWVARDRAISNWNMMVCENGKDGANLQHKIEL